MPDQPTKQLTTLSEAQLQKIQEAVANIRYGTVTLVIQDGKLIQIDRAEKIRLKTE